MRQNRSNQVIPGEREHNRNRCRASLLAAIFMVIANGAFAQNDTASYEYDALGRLSKVTYPGGQEKEYRYDPAGNRTEDLVTGGDDGPINDNVPTLGIGPNLIDLTNWPKGSAPGGPGHVSNWLTSPDFYNETRWARVTGPGSSNTVTAMETGQTEPDADGGGTNATNTFVIDPQRAYEFSVYIRKHNVSLQNVYFGLETGGTVKNGWANSVNWNPYFLAWSVNTQQTYLDPNEWYKVVGYVFPEGYPVQSNPNWGGIYNVATGNRIASTNNYRWNEDRSNDVVFARFFTYYSHAVQNVFSNYYYSPEVRVTNISYTPVVPSASISHANANEGQPVSFYVNLSETTTVDVKVNYSADHPGGSGSASSGDYTATSGTLVIPAGSTQGLISVNTTQDSIHEGSENIRLSLSAPVRVALSESTELATIIDDDAPPSFSVSDATETEGGTLTFTVTRTGATTQFLDVNYSTANNTAIAGSDYSAASSNLVFHPSLSTRTFTVATTQDSNVEANETFYVNLSGASAGSTIGDGQGVGTIVNDDVANSPPNAVNNYYNYLVNCCAPIPDKYLYPLTNDSDPDNDPLTITSITQPPGSVSATLISSSTIRLDINTSYYNGSMTYSISDGNGGTDTATIYINIEENE